MGVARRSAEAKMQAILAAVKGAKDEMGRPIIIPIEYQINGSPSGDGGGAPTRNGTPPPAEGNTDALFRDKNVLGAYSQDFPDFAARIEEWLNNGGRGDESRAPGDLGLPEFWEWFNEKGFRGSASGGIYSKPAMRVIAERSPEIVGDSNTIVSALAQAMQRVGFGDKAGSGGGVTFNLTTPLATVDTVRQMVYSEIGPLFLDWIEGNKGGGRTRMQLALGIPAK